MSRTSFSRAGLLALVLTLASATSSLAQALGQAPTGDNTRRVIAIREATLKSGVAAWEFEQYFSDVYARTLADRIPGLQAYLLRGERGERKDKYLMVFEFDTLARRNEYWPQPGEASERFGQLTRNMPQFELDKYADISEQYTDYLVLNR